MSNLNVIRERIRQEVCGTCESRTIKNCPIIEKMIRSESHDG